MALDIDYSPWSAGEYDILAYFLAKQDYWTHERMIPLRWAFPSREGNDQAILTALASQAHEHIKNLDESFKRANYGKYIVVSYSGDVVALGDSIQAIRTQLKEAGIRGNVHIERIGFRSLTKLSR